MAWLTDWAKRIEIAIDQTNISGETNFPVYVPISTTSGIGDVDVSCVFDEVGAESLKIAVTEADGTTQCYVEVVSWDEVGEYAELWVKVAAPTSNIFLYYDSTKDDNSSYVGITGSTPAKAVWDANFVAVYHMNDNPDTSHIKDSTSNNNDGTKKGANEPVEAAGSIGNAQDFDGSDDRINCSNNASLNVTAITMEAIENRASWGSYQGGLTKGDRWGYGGYGGKIRARLTTDSGIQYWYPTNSSPINDETYIAITYNGAGTAIGYIDGTNPKTDTTTHSGSIATDSSTLYLGYWLGYVAEVMDEIRISNIARSADWIAATNQVLTDTLLTFGDEETAPVNVTIVCPCLNINLGLNTPTARLDKIIIAPILEISIAFKKPSIFHRLIPYRILRRIKDVGKTKHNLGKVQAIHDLSKIDIHEEEH